MIPATCNDSLLNYARALMGTCFSAAQVQSAATPPNSSPAGAADLASTKESRSGRGVSEAALKAIEESKLHDGTLTVPTQDLHPFSYLDLKTATRNFRSDSFLGEGGFGSVFRGHIDERTFAPSRPGQGLLIAVKRLNPEGLQGNKEWLAELYFLGALHHPNLVKLIGYCYEGEHRLLVYEFLSRGSLENHLFGRSRNTLSWETRLKIACDAARGLACLHDAPKPVIYRDFKTSNILLDADFNAKLSDFGLAKDGPTGDKTHVTTRVMGTFGYAAPEYVATGRLTSKSDVYGFGVVLLEILTGRKAVDKDKSGVEQNLVEWAIPYLEDKRKWSRVLDQKLEGQYSLRGAQKAATLALQCLDQDAKKRPTMKQVLQTLEPLLVSKDLYRNTSSGTSASTSSNAPSRSRSHNRNDGQNLESTTSKQDHNSKPHTVKQDHNSSTDAAKQDHKLVDQIEPLSAFKLPSPKPSHCQRDNNNGFPSSSPTRSAHRQERAF